MGILTNKHRAGNLLVLTIFRQRLTDGSDMHIVKGSLSCRATVARSTKTNRLSRIGGIGLITKILANQLGHINKLLRSSRLTSFRV